MAAQPFGVMSVNSTIIPRNPQQPTSSGLLGLQAKSPTDNLRPPTTNLASSQVKAPSAPAIQSTSGGTTRLEDNPYYFRTGESVDQYNARVSAYIASKNSGVASTLPGPQTPMPTYPSSQAQAPTSQAAVTPQPYTPNTGLMGQAIAALANRSNQPSQQYTEAYNKAQSIADQQTQLQNNYAQQTANIESSPIDLSLATGQQGILARLFAAKQASLANQYQGATNLLGQANTQQGLQQNALQQAASLSSPQQVPYSNQYLSPITGQPIGGAAAGGSLQDAVSNVVQKLQNGTMSYNDATQALSGYGQGGINALQQALPSGFNIAQSNTLAGQQGSIGPAYSFAKSALTSLQSLVQQLGGAQGTNIPALNSIGNWISTTFGINSDKTRQYIGAVQEARNAYSQLLAASQGGTPTQYGEQANAAIPDNATPNDIQAAINNLESLGQSKLNIYGNPGQSTTQQNNASGNSIYNF